MKKWDKVRRLIADQPRPPLSEAREFWAAFQRQAPRRRPAAATRLAPLARPWLAWAAAGAACAGLVWLLGSRWWPARPAPVDAACNSVTAIDVLARHDSLFILQDSANRGTIIWIDLCPVTSDKHGS